MKKRVVVTISYYDFIFDDVDEAVKFAEIAKRTIEDGRKGDKISISIEFENENEEEQ